MDDASNLAIDNYRALNRNQRRAIDVRINGEEHAADSRNGIAQIHFPMDGQMMQISELTMKLIINDGIVNGGGESGDDPCKNWSYGLNTYPTYSDWLLRYPPGSSVNIDCTYGCQCFDYAAAFWAAQVNRWLETGNGFAWGIWELKRTVNAGSDFALISKWSDIIAGDWVVWGDTGTGHIAMALEPVASGGAQILFRQQNLIGSSMGSPIQDSALGPFLENSNRFLGAFRYLPWQPKTN